ncbi:hypothetical protein [Flavobacterium alkalisoli]|uniref:hypothetical protein n=1 Tax=Flavobacterium alkalisoli TaxID=2602769 RepID=UPI003A8CC114
MAVTKTKKGLSNPAVLATVASSPAGQKAVTGAIDTTFTVVKIVAVALVVGVGGYVAYNLYKNRFVSLATNPNYEPSNISEAVANAKADALYNAMYGWGADLETVLEALSGINYNAWVKVYNAFGKRKPTIGSEMTLTEWLNNQFTSQLDRSKISLLIPVAF